MPHVLLKCITTASKAYALASGASPAWHAHHPLYSCKLLPDCCRTAGLPIPQLGKLWQPETQLLAAQYIRLLLDFAWRLGLELRVLLQQWKGAGMLPCGVMPEALKNGNQQA
jgi:hypothetical protein